jgi:hypothetical protein
VFKDQIGQIHPGLGSDHRRVVRDFDGQGPSVQHGGIRHAQAGEGVHIGRELVRPYRGSGGRRRSRRRGGLGSGWGIRDDEGRRHGRRRKPDLPRRRAEGAGVEPYHPEDHEPSRRPHPESHISSS